ncbi:MAG: bifunctional alpha/beta hydrolase/OsmC family protein [Brevundimonas sp.]|uniref:bifunctional alpha/beta hydrolase/OsmC family protein n=1 Tax=Brevundimonas sp. TaxID=1871086 RepID=UPI002728ABD4|nr:bifunctional alpha/beta hydrolase/OsmC family protein [Brevundimonas sp.]MDO9586853.1 bifunctional alpha/beta hydrolase/OsmC family protein [Brevundimonas sp.]
MTAADFDFANATGRTLTGVLESGQGPVRAWAVFAHCFTCDKTSLAATRVSRALADRGIGVLRFDFTGLGESEGQFGAGLSGDVQDVVCAARAMAAAGMEPRLLVGHSFGGAAVLAAAHALETIRAVAVIGTPFDAEHVLTHVGSTLEGLASGRRVPVSIAGRDFELGADFVEDIRSHNQQARIAGLGRALLVLHSPTDDIVSIDNASGIFQAARHPKSFVSLDHADHLLTRRADADYAAGVIAAWADRYLGAAEAAGTDLAPPLHGLRVEETGGGKFQVRITTPSGAFFADEPSSVGGLGTGPTPYDLLGAALGACTAMTCRLYADRKGWPLERIVVEVDHVAKTSSEPDQFTRRIGFTGALDGVQRSRLFEIADRCPVHRTLTESATVSTGLLIDSQPDAGAPDNPEDHLLRMQDLCKDDFKGVLP